MVEKLPKIKVCIIVLNWNGKQDTLTCLQSIQNVSYPHLETIVVDNGSSDDCATVITREFPNVILLQSEKNLGYAGGNNLGIKYGLAKGYDFFFILNNDTIVDQKVIENFLKGFDTHPDAGILGAKTYLMDEPDKLDHLGGVWDPKALSFQLVGLGARDKELWQKPLELDYVCGAAMMIRRSVLESLGLPHEPFFLYWEESDFCFQAKAQGFKVMSCPDAKVWHKSGASMANRAFQKYFFHRNRLLWIERNFSGAKRWRYLLRILGKDLPKYYKRLWIKKMQLFFENTFTPKKDQRKKRAFIKNTSAIVAGMQDYLLRRFYQGNSSRFLD